MRSGPAGISAGPLHAGGVLAQERSNSQESPHRPAGATGCSLRGASGIDRVILVAVCDIRSTRRSPVARSKEST